MKCECADPLCPVCHGHCNKSAVSCLVRVDMDDETGTMFCAGCSDDAMESGLFREDVGLKIKHTTRRR